MEANIAYYCLHKLHRWPHEFLALDRYEKAIVIAAVEMKLEKDRKEAQKLKSCLLYTSPSPR
uniref:hypothetical protein n=1 Tax=Enterocloster clostridioformis TaxID=1531 RepID=UPI0026E23DFF